MDTASPQQNPVQPPIQVPVSQPPTKPVAPSPVSGPHKEYGPIGTKPVEYLTPSEPGKVELHPDIKEAGVEQAIEEDEIQISKEVRDAGLHEAKAATPVITAPTGKVELPTEMAALSAIKKSDVHDSLRWLSTLALFVHSKLKIAHATLTKGGEK